VFNIVATIGCIEISPPIGPLYPQVIAHATSTFEVIYINDAIPDLIQYYG